MEATAALISSSGPVTQVARLLSAKDRGGTYFLEYTVQKPGEQQPRHFLSAVSLGYNGRCAVLLDALQRCRVHQCMRCQLRLQLPLGAPAYEFLGLLGMHY